jgi:hypothetical protein
MHRHTFIFILICCSNLSLVQAQERGFGLGIIVGEPTGISFKNYLANDRAIAGAVAWRLWHGSAFHVHADYLFHNRTLLNVPRGSLPIYYGVGARARTWTGGRYWRRGRYHEFTGTRFDLGIRIPVGIAYEFDGAPLDIFLEVVPILDLIPATRLDVNGGLGVRFWF